MIYKEQAAHGRTGTCHRALGSGGRGAKSRRRITPPLPIGMVPVRKLLGLVNWSSWAYGQADRAPVREAVREEQQNTMPPTRGDR